MRTQRPDRARRASLLVLYLFLLALGVASFLVVDAGQGLVTVPCDTAQVCQTNVQWVIAGYVLIPIGGVLTAKALASEWARWKARPA